MSINDYVTSENKFSNICENILLLDESIRFVGILTKNGKLLEQKFHNGIERLLSEQQTKNSISSIYQMHQSNLTLESNIGQAHYSVNTFEKIKRSSIVLKNGNILVISFDKNKDEYVILNKIMIYLNNKILGYDLNIQDEVAKILEDRIKKEKLEIVSKLSSRLAHDIRNPLSIIKACTTVLELKKSINDDGISEFAKIHRAIDRIVHQVDDVFEYLTTVTLEKQLVSINDIISPLIDELKLIRNNIKIEFLCDDEVLYCDKQKLKTVFQNILLNSVHVLEDKGGKIKISVSGNAEWVIIQFEDSGSIKKEHLPQIFDPLFTTKQKGTGLGLTSCKNIIEQHNGSIHLKINPTVFTIHLPK